MILITRLINPSNKAKLVTLNKPMNKSIKTTYIPRKCFGEWRGCSWTCVLDSAGDAANLHRKMDYLHLGVHFGEWRGWLPTCLLDAIDLLRML